MSPEGPPSRRVPVSLRSRFALNAVNFFLAELSGIGSPYLSDFLHDSGWGEGAIGLAASMPGLGILLLLPVAGLFLDRARYPRRILLATALSVGLCYVSLPWLIARSRGAVYGVLFASGLAQAFFAPLLSGLALGLVGQAHLNRVMGANQAWNHVGDVVAAVVALALTQSDVSHVFYLVGVIGALAGTSGLLIRRREIDVERASGGTERRVKFRALLKDRRVLVLLVSAALFHTTYASTFPFLVLRVRNLGGSDSMVAVLVMVSQASMTPVALAAGRALHLRPHKPVFAFAFVLMPVFIVGCAIVRNIAALVGLEAIGSVSAGIFGVAIVALCADLTRGTGRFHALTGASNAAMATGSVVGPVATGLLVEEWGHTLAFFALAACAAAAAWLFVARMPETRAMPGEA